LQVKYSKISVSELVLNAKKLRLLQRIEQLFKSVLQPGYRPGGETHKPKRKFTSKRESGIGNCVDLRKNGGGLNLAAMVELRRV